MAQSYQDVLYSLSLLARKMGVTLLYEDIEASYQLQYAWRNGGIQLQVIIYISRLLLVISRLRCNNEGNVLNAYRSRKEKLLAVYQLTERFQDKMQQVMTKCRKLETYDDMLPVIAEELSNVVSSLLHLR